MRWNRVQSSQIAADESVERLLAQTTRVLRRIIAHDEKTQYRLQALGTCCIGFKFSAIDKMLGIAVNDGEISVVPGNQCNPDVILTGGIADFLSMARSQGTGSPLAAGKVEIQGDLAMAQHVQSLIAELDIDLEDWVAQFTGDVPARQLGRALRGSVRWLSRAHKVIERDISEFLLYEQRLTPTAREVEAFVEAGVSIRNDVDRLDARIARIVANRKAR